ncbi:hypothetical protein [Sphingomonas sp.]|uniref:hypothetical protein n=1 Tax=Sphingomonas sp. TaxID=28214 RepID=UPI003B3BD5E2
MIKAKALLIAASLATACGAAPHKDEVQPQTYLKDAAGACQARNFDTFFDAFVWSPDVRRKYSAPVIEERAFGAPAKPGVKRPASSQRFEIAMIDFYYVDEASAERWEKQGTPLVDLALDRKALPGGAWTVTYQSALMKDDGEGDGKTLIRKIGKPKAYIFAWTGGCWKLTQWLK